MLENLIVKGYRYSDLNFFLPLSLSQEVRDSIDNAGALAGLRLRDYVLDGGRVGIDLGETNRSPDQPEFWYSAQCKTLPPEQQTDDTIGSITLNRHSSDGVVVQTQELNLEELDNSHILDRLRSAAIEFHTEIMGQGPHATGPKRKPKP